MKRNISALVIFVISIISVVGLLFFKSAESKNTGINNLYGEYVANGPVYAKFVQVKPILINDYNYKDFIIETLGYSEIRVYAQLFKDDYKAVPMKSDGILKINFSHEMSGLGVGYKTNTYKNEYTSYIDGWATEKIYGRKTKVAVDADNIPKGKYTLQLSYYLLP
ncbi:MAG: hypothetical protein C4539_00955 [Ignavibacteriales bacterium]|nr:MAG: hypothetical protein C4539_00955 [Ignavibacteriales bacterium]